MSVTPVYLEEADVDALAAVIAMLSTRDKELTQLLKRFQRKVVEVVGAA